jgi:selenocysteine lyase/cysteine desulfurase
LLAGLGVTFDYLDSIGGFAAIRPHEESLGQRFLDTISDAVTVYGLPTMEGRVPTFLINVAGVDAADVAAGLAQRDIGVWAHDSWYSLHLYRSLGYEDQAVRLGFLHYNSVAEVDRVVEALQALA